MKFIAKNFTLIVSIAIVLVAMMTIICGNDENKVSSYSTLNLLQSSQPWSVVASGSSLPTNVSRQGYLFFRTSDSTLWSSTGLTWNQIGPISGVTVGWQDDGTDVRLTTTTDEVIIGATTPISSAKFSIDGDADQIQALIQGNATQNEFLLLLETSAGTDRVSVANSGLAVFGNSSTAKSVSIDPSGSEVIMKFEGSGGADWSITTDNLNDEAEFSGASGGYYFNGRVSIGPGDDTFPSGTNIITSMSSTNTANGTRVCNGTTGSSTSDGIVFGITSAQAGQIWNYENTSLLIATNNNQRMNITNAGVVTVEDAILTAESGLGIGAITNFILSAAGAATVSAESNVELDTNASAALDTAVTLTGVIGQIIYIQTTNSGRDIAFLDTGNFALQAERLLDDVDDLLVLKATTTTTWKEVSFANNN